MAFHFQCDLSPCLTNAAASRFLITTIPSCYYVSWPSILCSPFPVGSWTCSFNGNQYYSNSNQHGTPNKNEFQVFDGAVNLTLQAAARIICESLNQLADNGVPISDEP